MTSPGTTEVRLSSRILLAVVCASIFFDAMDLSITQIALPSIQSELDVSSALLPWIATAYVVVYGGCLLLGGRLSDVMGARRIFLTGLVIFGLASLACGLVSGVWQLVVCRGVQGLGAALTVPSGIALLVATFAEGAARNRAFAAFAAAASSGFTAGLVTGGAITQGLSWRWIFLIKVPLVAVAVVAAWRAAPGPAAAGRSRGYDLAGAVTVTLAGTLLMAGVSAAGAEQPEPALVGGLIAVALALTAAFVLIENRAEDPLLPIRLLRDRRLIAADLAALTVLAAPFAVSFLITLYWQAVLGRSPWQTAAVLLPGSVLSAVIGLFVAPRLLERVGLRTVFIAGLVLVALGNTGLLAVRPATATVVVIAATLVTFGLGMGLAYPAATLGGVAGASDEDRGTAAGLNNTALQLGGGLGLAVVGAVVSSRLGGDDIATLGSAQALGVFQAGVVVAGVIPVLGAVALLLLFPAGNTSRER